MMIAVASAGLDVCESQPSLSGFMCYTVERGIIARSQNYSGPVPVEAAWPQVLGALGIDTLLVCQIEPSARAALERQGIEVVSGFTGKVQDAVRSYLSHLMSGVFDDAEARAV